MPMAAAIRFIRWKFPMTAAESTVASGPIAAATACGLRSIGLENNPEYFKMAKQAIPNLAVFSPNGAGSNGRK